MISLSAQEHEHRMQEFVLLTKINLLEEKIASLELERDKYKASIESTKIRLSEITNTCSWCLEFHEEGKCYFQKWTPVLVGSTRPLFLDHYSDVLKRIRLVKNKWIVMLIPKFRPLIVASFIGSEMSLLDGSDMTEIEKDDDLIMFRYLTQNNLANFGDANSRFANWISDNNLTPDW